MLSQLQPLQHRHPQRELQHRSLTVVQKRQHWLDYSSKCPLECGHWYTLAKLTVGTYQYFHPLPLDDDFCRTRLGSLFYLTVRERLIKDSKESIDLAS